MSRTPPEEAPRTAPAAGDEFAPGHVLEERYQIQKKLGKGGMGTVYSAWDRDYEKNVAVKVISPEWAGDKAMVASLQKEVARAKAIPPHPNLLTVHEAHLRANPPLITLELAKEDLHVRWVGRGRKLDVDETRALMGQVLAGLGALHDAGLVHRDIKPENILLTEAGQAKISDYGISKSAQEQVQARGSDGSGTPMYMAPEQLAGAVTDLRADLYSVGVMVYELTVGRLPFQGTSAEAMSLWHRQGLRDVSEVPEALQAFVGACMAIDPDDRPRDTAAAAAAMLNGAEARERAEAEARKGEAEAREAVQAEQADFEQQKAQLAAQQAAAAQGIDPKAQSTEGSSASKFMGLVVVAVLTVAGIKVVSILGGDDGAAAAVAAAEKQKEALKEQMDEEKRKLEAELAKTRHNAELEALRREKEEAERKAREAKQEMARADAERALAPSRPAIDQPIETVAVGGARSPHMVLACSMKKGSSNAVERAQKKIAQIRAAGFPAGQVVDTDNPSMPWRNFTPGYYSCVVASYGTRDEAIQLSRSMKAAGFSAYVKKGKR